MLDLPMQVASPGLTRSGAKTGHRPGAGWRAHGSSSPPMDVSPDRRGVGSELGNGAPGDGPPGDGDEESLDRLVAFTYDELRAIAHARLAGRGGNGTLSTTALVHEAYLKLVNHSAAKWRDRGHFFAVASLAMRHVLVDFAKARHTLKRGGEARRISLEEAEIGVDEQADALLQLDDALTRLAEVEPRLAKVVELRFFGGLTEGETAEALGVVVRTVRRDWVKARVMLRHVLES